MRYFFTPLCAASIPLCLMTGTAIAQVADQVPEQTAEQASEQTAAPDPIATTTIAEDTSGNNVFLADYFTQYAPRTALDMIGQIPGFSIRAGDLSKRGLGQGGANILINGERLTGKADPFDELDQILSRNVVSITIVDGASLSIPGLSGQVADIKTKASSFSGSWEWTPQFRESLRPNWFNGRVNVSGETGNLNWSAFFRDYSFRGGVSATQLRRDADGQLFETRLEDVDNYGDRPGIGANLTWKPAEGHTANLNAEYALFNFRRKVDAERIPATERGDDSLTRNDGGEDERYLEIGADYQRPLFNGTVKLTGYLEREWSPTENTFSVFDPRTGFEGASRFVQDADEAETIARGEYSWAPKEGRSWDVGLEAAFNSLDVTQELFLQDPGDDFIGEGPSSFSVSEDRYEATLTHSRTLNPKWDLQASIGVEQSELTQMRDDLPMVEPQDFLRPKGFVSASYKPREETTWRFQVGREVGQLNFFDFVASVDLIDDLGREGNPDLVPSQSWNGSVEYQHDFGQGNTINVEVYGALISDIVDRIPVGDDGDAVGNLDSTAYRYGFEISGTFKGEKWGWDGTQLDYEFDWRDSNVEDPLLGFNRRLNGDLKTAFEVSFRHDIPNTDWAYGAFIEDFVSSRQFRTFTISQFGNTNPFTGVYLEHKDILGLKARVQLMNPFSITDEFAERTVFDGRRDNGVILRTEDSNFDFGPILQFRFSGEF
jgi:hypothetical protein